MLAVIIGLSLLAAGWMLARRSQIERANRTVAIAVDFNRAQELAELGGVAVEPFLRMLKSAGTTHVAVLEDNLGDLITEGKITLGPDGAGVTLIPTPEVRERALAQLRRRLPGGKETPEGGMSYRSARAIDLLRPMGMGYPEEAVAAAAASGLRIVARPVGEMAITQQAIDAALDAMKAIDADVAVFSGIQVFGVYDLIEYAAEGMQQRGIAFGYLEMAQQFGDNRLAAALKTRIIRCHAVAAEEMIKLPPQRAIDRFGLAVRERNVRLCYVRPYILSSADPVHASIEYVAAITQGICRAGYRIGVPQPFLPLRVAQPALALLLIGIGAGAIWLVQLVLAMPARVFWVLIAADIVLSGAAALLAPGLAQSAGALGAAIVFPTLALLSIQMREPGGTPSILRGIGLFLLVCLISIVGGLLAAACLSDLPHMMAIATFRGVKLSQLLPLLAVIFVFAPRCTKAYEAVRTELGPHLAEWPALRAGMAEAAAAVVRYWHVGLIVLGMALAALLLLRSGNVTPLPPSALELKVRGFLEATLAVRPRSKELFLGHPALILTLAFLLAGWRRGLWIGMLMGAVGQVSLANTFTHIHTPIAISLVRVFNGVWLGVLGAVFLWLVGSLALRVFRRAREP